MISKACKSLVCICFLFVLTFSQTGVARAADKVKFATGPATPFTGNDSDLATVELQVKLSDYQIAGSVFDSGSIVVSNAPPKGKGANRCGPDANQCVCAAAGWLVGGKKGSLVPGNEIVYIRNAMFPITERWQRLPGPLFLSFVVRGNIFFGISSGGLRSDTVEAKAGGHYVYELVRVPAQGGFTIQFNLVQADSPQSAK